MTQLALQLEPPPCVHADSAEQADAEISKALLPCSLLGQASSLSGALATERCRARPRSLGDRLLEGLDQMVRKAEEAEQDIRQLHADVLGIDVSKLDEHLAAEEAEEARLRQEARASQPARASMGRAAKGGDAIGIGRAALSPRQRELLAHVRVENNLAVYTSSERIADWDLLKRVMLALGGTWKTGGKKAPGGFRFPDDLDAAELVRLAKETGEITDPKAAEFFPTPKALAELLVERAELEFCSRVLEPSAGLGSIALAARARQPGAHIVCVEALPASAAKLADLGFDTTVADFLTLTPEALNTFTHVLLNPPFSRRQDIQHVRHAYKFLEPGGVLVAIMSAGVKYRQDKLATDFREFVEANQGEIWANPDGSFLESGTGVRTVMVRIRRPA